MANEPSQEIIKKMLDYDSLTGQFTWKIAACNSIKVGDLAGGVTKAGYVRIGIDGKECLAHRLAWIYVYGRAPELNIDHIDGVKKNNRIANLRDVSRFTNTQNQKGAHKRSKTGLLGASFHKESQKYRAKICANGIDTIIGLFDTPEAAHLAYLSKKRELHQGCTI